MNMREERLPRPESELEALANYYDEYDAADEMEDREWVEPMVTTSLRLPRGLFDEIKSNALREGKRQSAYIREALERSVHGESTSSELARIQRKLDVLLLAVNQDDPPSGGPEKRSA